MARTLKVAEEDVTFGTHSIALTRRRIEANTFANEKSVNNVGISFSIKIAFNRNE
jgi:hypothetical protein